MKQIVSLIASRLPSKAGKEAQEQLKQALSHGGIQFDIRHISDEAEAYFLAESRNLSGKHIVTTGRTLAELERNMKDAIFTAFQVPAYYCDDRMIQSPLANAFTLRYATG